MIFFASILLFKDRIIMDDVKSNTSDKGHHKFYCNQEYIYVDYKPSKQIRNICKFHTCKYLLFFNLLFYIYSKIINMHLSFKFLRETPRKRVLSINPGNNLSRRNTEKFHRETPRNFAQTISFTWLISRCFSEK